MQKHILPYVTYIPHGEKYIPVILLNICPKNSTILLKRTNLYCKKRERERVREDDEISPKNHKNSKQRGQSLHKLKKESSLKSLGL